MASRSSKVISLSLAKSVLMVVNVVSGMVLARVLTKAGYGTYLQTFLAYNFALPILTLGLPEALFYFLPRAKDRKKRLVLENLLLLFGAGLIFSLFLSLGGAELLANKFNNPDLVNTLKWMTFYPLYTFPVLAGGAVWIAQDKVKLNAIFNVANGLLVTGAVIITASITKSFEAPTIARITLPIIFLPIAINWMFKYVPGDWNKPNLASIWRMVKFSIPLGLASIFGTITRQIANMIVSMLTTPEDFAIYANGAKEVPFISIITGSIAVVIMVDMAQNIKQGDLNKALELFRKASVISASVLLPVMVFLMIFAESFIQILYSSKYEASVLPFRIYLFVLPVRIAYYGSAFIALGRTKAILLRSILDLGLTAFLSYLFVIWLGAFGAAIGLVLTMFIWSVPFNLFSLSKSFKCKPFFILPFEKIGKIMLYSLFSGVISLSVLALRLPSIINFTLGAILFGIIYILITYKYISEFRNLVNSVKTKFLPIKL